MKDSDSDRAPSAWQLDANARRDRPADRPTRLPIYDEGPWEAFGPRPSSSSSRVLLPIKSSANGLCLSPVRLSDPKSSKLWILSSLLTALQSWVAWGIYYIYRTMSKADVVKWKRICCKPHTQRTHCPNKSVQTIRKIRFLCLAKF